MIKSSSSESRKKSNADISQKGLKTFSKTDILEQSVKYFGGDEMAAQVWMSKYALKDSEGNCYEVTPDAMHRRMANELHRMEIKYPNPLTWDEIYEVLKDFKYVIPQGGSMAGIEVLRA